MDRWSLEDKEQWVEERLGMYTDGADIKPDMRRRAEEEYEDMTRDMDQTGIAS